MKLSNYLLFFSVLICIFNQIKCWDNIEMQMFDLVEEVNQDFYEYLGVTQNATGIDIRRAYRKLSLIHHPDKNPNSEDGIKFRRLVAIYEVLRDDKMRERYNEVLKFGLPDWRMPAFYFRKLRKMSFVESFILFSILATAIHYACLWGAFFEQKLNLEAYLFRRKRKRNHESVMNEQLNTVYKPRWKDILPLAIVKFFYNFVISIPRNIKFIYDLIKKEIYNFIDKQFEQKRKDKAKEDERKKIDAIKKQKKERKQVFSKENKEKRKIYEIGKQNAMTLPIETFNDIPISDNDHTNESDEVSLDPWTEKETVAVIRALSKFPAGVDNRWIKISDFVKRPLKEVIKEVKKIQENSKEGKVLIDGQINSSLGNGVEECSEQKVIYIDPFFTQDSQCLSESDEEDDEEEFCSKSSAQKKKERKKVTKKNIVITVPITKLEEVLPSDVVNEEDDKVQNIDESIVYQRKKPRTKAKYLETSDPLESAVWTHIEQKQLEDAIRSFPKGTTDRWDRISQKIPTKTKTECMDRIKYSPQVALDKN